MNTNVNKLLDADREARRLLDEARQYYDRTMVEIQEEKNKLLAAYKEKADLHIHALEDEQGGEIEETMEAVRKRTASTIAAMDARYDELHSQWEQELAQKCMGW